LKKESHTLKPIDRIPSSELLSDTPMLAASTKLSNATKRLRAQGLILLPVLMLTVCADSGYAAKVAAMLAGAEMPRAQKHESRHEIDHLEEAWRDAILKQNTTAMEGLLAEDYMAITGYGTLQTKEQTLANLRTGRMHFTTLDVSDRKVRFYGTTALVTSLAEVQGTTDEGDISGNYRYTHVYVRDAKGAWKIVSFEASKVREAGK
jgi:ketosteroid isomerase-like protein